MVLYSSIVFEFVGVANSVMLEQWWQKSLGSTLLENTRLAHPAGLTSPARPSVSGAWHTAKPNHIWQGLVLAKPNQILNLALTKPNASLLRCICADACQLNTLKNLEKLYSYIFLDPIFFDKNTLKILIKSCSITSIYQIW
jgi:hypothetical protein